ncbi:hypothetical protein ACSBR2_008438 [Camellia fascicularis]
MVAQQGELAIRIDDNMEESLTNVESARSALLRHLNQISSNRWLRIKIFAILIFFLMLDLATSGKGGIGTYIGICMISCAFGVADAHVQGGMHLIIPRMAYARELVRSNPFSCFS